MSETNTYLLAEATDEGINAMYNFLNHGTSDEECGAVNAASLTQVFFSLKVSGTDFSALYEDENKKLELPNEGGAAYSKGYLPFQNDYLTMPDKCLFLRLNEETYKNSEVDEQTNEDNKVYIYETGPSVTFLPKELEVTQYSVDSAVEALTGCVNYNGSGSFDKEMDLASKKTTWQTYVNKWTDAYDTVIGNYQSQLDYAQKTVSSLRKKVGTFDSMGSSFRSKAYTIYNKIVNKIN